MMAYSLGTVEDDPRGAYLAWAAAVKAHGGVVTTAPHMRSQADQILWGAFASGGGDAVVAARYPVAFVFPHAPDATLNPLFHAQPDDWSTDGRYVYYVAPAAVQRYASGGDITTPQRVPGESPPPNPQWYDDIKRYAKYAGYAVGGLVLLNVLSFVPRRRR